MIYCDAIKVFQAMQEHAHVLRLQIDSLMRVPSLGAPGVPAFSNVADIETACIQLEQRIQELQKELVDLKSTEGQSPELDRLASIYCPEVIPTHAARWRGL